jgi:hypothetical protein
MYFSTHFNNKLTDFWAIPNMNNIAISDFDSLSINYQDNGNTYGKSVLGIECILNFPLKLLLIKIFVLSRVRSRNSSVGIANGCRLDGRGSIPGRVKFSLFFITSRPILGPT